MIEAGTLTQQDADEYRIELSDEGHSIHVQDVESGYTEVVLTMSNQDALELAAQLLIGAVYNASDSDFRETAWNQLLRKRIASTVNA